MPSKEDQVKKKIEEDKAHSRTVNDYVREFRDMLQACELRAQRKPADSSTLTAEQDAHMLRGLLDDLQEAQEKGQGELPILRTQAEWDVIDGIRQRSAEYGFEKTQSFEQSRQSTPGLTQPASTMNTQNYDQENLFRLGMLNRYNEKPRSEEEEEQARKSGENTFIAYKDLEKMAKNGEKFFLPPNSEEDACLSCGNGCLYKGSLSEIRMQLQSDLKNNPGNDNLKTGLERIEKEIIAKPNFALSKKKDHSEEETTSQENTYTTPNPFSIKPKNTPT
jgi:hypothetical protein